MKNNTRKYAKITTKIPGEKSLEYFNLEQKYISPGTQTISTLTKIVPEKGEGCIIEDVDGNRYIDFIAGVGVAGIGYAHPKYVKMVQEQVAKIHVGSYTSKNRAELTKELAENSLGDLKRTQFYSSGSEAVEAAFRLAKSYTKKTEFIGFWEGFHGKTLGVVGLLGDTFKNNLGPLPVGTYSSPYANCRHCPFNDTFPECKWTCIDFLKKKLRYETTNNIAAIVVEPIQGTAGNVVPPKGFLVKLKELAEEIGALLIADEMITGFGRTGKMWGSLHDNVIPDIITIGKGFGGGFPMSGLMSRDEIIFSKPFANPSGSSSSYGGNPLASAASNAALKIIKEDGLVENSEKVGAFMLEKLSKFEDKFPFVGEVRGKGLMIGVELTKNKKTKEKLDKSACEMIFFECLNRGLITMSYNPCIRINPPLVITKEIAEEGIEIMDEVFSNVADRINI
jgi:4-aminobutyrate aminotransferase / (S)-3-amino-2-methylpropionate transaminase / 5-aminovalerate transaminase